MSERIATFQLEARAWRCPCGEICQPVSALWRFTGAGWEHGHEYPAGHVAAVRHVQKVAVHTGDGWYLCEENIDGDVIDENGIPWPKDWPDYVTSEFLEERGFEVV